MRYPVRKISVIPGILSYDRGVLLSIRNEDKLRMYLSGHNATLLSPSVKVSTDKEKVIYSPLVSIFFSSLSPTWAR